MGSIRVHPAKGTLFLDFRYNGERKRQYTALADNASNRKRLQRLLDRIDAEITLGTFDYLKTFGVADATAIPAKAEPSGRNQQTQHVSHQLPSANTSFRDFANQWFRETKIAWRRSYQITQRGDLDKHLLPKFGAMPVSSIMKDRRNGLQGRNSRFARAKWSQVNVNPQDQ